jgi:hypothetical protein
MEDVLASWTQVARTVRGWAARVGPAAGIARQSTHDPPLELVDGEPQFRFFVAGARASGKTVFLASLHNQLAVPGQDNFFHARLTSEESANYLRRNFDIIREPGLIWPLGTADASEYVFQCFHSSVAAQDTFPLFRFHYMDFPGGDLTNTGPNQSIDVKQQILRAHTIVFLIDGKKILDALNGTPIKGYSINDDLDRVSELAMDCIWKPTQFVITKWDILSQHALPQIRRLLMKHPKFSEVVRIRRNARKPTYLIPVSAVGAGFAHFDASGKAMVKLPHAAPNPYNLDLTLALVIADTLRESIKSMLNGDMLKNNLLQAVSKYKDMLNWLIQAGTMITGNPWLGVIMLMLDKVSEQAVSLAEEADQRLATIKDKQSALDNIIYLQMVRVEHFLSESPAADLGRPLEGEI